MNICVFASGTGSNFRALIDSAEAGHISSKISLLITNNSDCGAAVIAAERGIECLHISKRKSDLSDNDYGRLFTEALEQRQIDFIALCGYMKMVEPAVTEKFRNRIINIHPALLPSFGGKGMYGINVHRAVIESGAKVSGITIHFVDGSYDTGRILFQKCVEVEPDDTEYTLEEKVKKLEHRYYPEAIKSIEEGRMALRGRNVFLF